MDNTRKQLDRNPPGAYPASGRRIPKHKAVPGLGYKERFLRAMIFLLDTSRGTLWRVREPVWMRNVEHYTDKGRKCHVGLSVDKRRCESVTDVLKLLIGTSKNKGVGLVVEGCFGDRSRRTTFFRLRPWPIPLADAYDEKRGAMIEPNPYKSRLNEHELSRLDEMLAAKGTIS